MTDRERGWLVALEAAYDQVGNLIALLELAEDEVKPGEDTMRLQSALSGIKALARHERARIEAALP